MCRPSHSQYLYQQNPPLPSTFLRHVSMYCDVAPQREFDMRLVASLAVFDTPCSHISPFFCRPPRFDVQTQTLAGTQRGRRTGEIGASLTQTNNIIYLLYSHYPLSLAAPYRTVYYLVFICDLPCLLIHLCIWPILENIPSVAPCSGLSVWLFSTRLLTRPYLVSYGATVITVPWSPEYHPQRHSMTLFLYPAFWLLVLLQQLRIRGWVIKPSSRPTS